MSQEPSITEGSLALNFYPCKMWAFNMVISEGLSSPGSPSFEVLRVFCHHNPQKQWVETLPVLGYTHLVAVS